MSTDGEQMKLIICILMVFGAMITFLSRKIADFILSEKREVNEADIVYIKLVGFAFVLAAAIIIFSM